MPEKSVEGVLCLNRDGGRNLVLSNEEYLGILGIMELHSAEWEDIHEKDKSKKLSDRFAKEQ